MGSNAATASAASSSHSAVPALSPRDIRIFRSQRASPLCLGPRRGGTGPDFRVHHFRPRTPPTPGMPCWSGEGLCAAIFVSGDSYLLWNPKPSFFLQFCCLVLFSYKLLVDPTL